MPRQDGGPTSLDNLVLVCAHHHNIIEPAAGPPADAGTSDSGPTVSPKSSPRRYRGGVAHITGHLRIAAPPELVFDTVADSRNEPSYNPAMTDVELLTTGPIGLGTRFRARMGRAGMEMVVQLTEYDRPRRLGSRTTSSMMETSGALTFTPEAGGTMMSWDWNVRPTGWFRFLGPLVGLLGGRMERRIWTGLKHHLESGAAT